MKKKLSLIFSILGAFSVSAQEYLLDKIEVTSPWEKDMQIQIPEEEIHQKLALDLKDLVQDQAGIDFQGGPRASGEQLLIRGLDDKRILILQDGARQNFRTQHSNAQLFDPDLIKSIEINKGPQACYANGASGGALRLTTKSAFDLVRNEHSYFFSPKYSYQSANDQNAWSAMSALKKDKLGILFSYGQRHAHDLEQADGNRLQSSAYEDHTYFLRGDYQNLKISYENYLQEALRPLNPQLDQYWEEALGQTELEKHNLALSYRYELFKNKGEASLYRNQTEEREERLSDKRKDQRKITTTGLRTQNSIPWRKHTIDYGLEIYEDQAKGSRDGNNLSSFPNGSAFYSSLYLAPQIELSRYWQIQPGLSFQSFNIKDYEDEKLLKSLGINFTPLNSLKLGLRYSEGLNAPRIQNLYVSGLHHTDPMGWFPDNYFVPNPDLKAEEIKNYELQMSYEPPQSVEGVYGKLNSNVYLTDFSNMIYQEIDLDAGTTQFTNLPKTQLIGHESTINFFNSYFDTQLSFAAVRGKNKQTRTNLAQMPMDKWSWKFSLSPWGERILLTYALDIYLKQDRFDEAEYEDNSYYHTPGYSLHSIYLAVKKHRHWELNLKVQNLGNKDYAAHGSAIKAAGRNIALGLRLFF